MFITTGENFARMFYAGLFLGILSFVLYLVRQYCAGGWCYSKTRLDGKTAIITGGSSGMGKEVARDFAKRGARVIIAGFDEKESENAVQEMVGETKNSAIFAMYLDLSSFRSIHTFAKEFLKREDNLHILVNNAGIFHVPRTVTEDGIERVFAVNYLGHFLLTNLLLERLKKCTPSRIVNVSSAAAYEGTRGIDFDDINSENDYDKFKVYSNSKLALLLFTKELSCRLKNDGVSVFALHPGNVITPIYQHFPLYHFPIVGTLLWLLRRLLHKTPVEGAQTIIYCAVMKNLEAYSGQFFCDCKVKELEPFAKSLIVAKKLWIVSKQMTGLRDKQ